MSKNIEKTTCYGCKATVPDKKGPVHPYIGSSPGCWEIYGDVLAREYSDYRFMKAHQLTVDTYAVQHPGKPGRRSSNSVSLHLLSLYLMLEKRKSAEFARQAMHDLMTFKKEFDWLDPPADVGRLTVVDIERVDDPKAYIDKVYAWASSAWRAWKPHHRTISDYAKRLLK